MKKILLIISLVITFAGILFTSSPYLLKITGLDEPLKQYLLPKLLKNPDDRLNFKGFRIGLSTIYLNDITAKVENGHIYLHIDAIRIHFNLMRLLQNPSEPQSTITAIQIIKPRVVVNRSLRVARGSSVVPDKQKTSLRNLFETFIQIRSIDKIAIREGQIHWISPNNRHFLLAHNVNGWLDARNFNAIIVESEGSLLASDANNISISLKIIPSERIIQANINIDEKDISKTFGALADGYLSILSGEIHGEINIISKNLDTDSTSINGTLDVKRLELQQNKYIVKDIRFFTELKNNELVVHEGSGYFSDQFFGFFAKIENIFNPVIHASINSKQFALKHLNDYLPLPALARSKVSMEVDVTTDLDSYSIQATARCDSLFLFKNEAFRDVNIDVEFKDRVIYLQKLQGRFFDLDIVGNGKYVPDANYISFNLNSNYKLANYSVFDRLSLKNQSARLSASYNLVSQVLTGKWAYLIAAGGDTVFASNGKILGDREQVSLEMVHCTYPDFSLYASARNFLSDQFNLQAKIANYPLGAFTSDPSWQKLFKRFETDARLSGTFSRLKGQILVTDRQNSKNDFRLNTVIKYPFSNHRDVKGSISFRNLLGFYDIALTPEKVEAVLRFPAGIIGKFSFAPGLDDAIRGQIRFQNFNVLQTFQDSTLSEDFRVQGSINGNILVDGTIQEPLLVADLSGDKFVFNDIGYYQANIHAAADKKRITLDSLDISLNNVNITKGSGYWDMQKKLIDLKLSGSDLDMQQIVTSIAGNDNLLTGIGKYEIELKGSIKNPLVEVTASVQEGALKDLSFDELKLSLQDRFGDLYKIYDWSSHAIIINNFYLGRAGRYHLSVYGVFPINETKPLNLGLDFDGDLFSFLPYWESFFVDGASLTTLNLEVAGTRKNIRLKKGELVIERGELWLADVAPHVENISGTVEFVNGTNQVDIKNLLAHVDNSVLRINTERNVTLPDGRKLKPWYFKDLDLDFGVLALQTNKKGVKIHIPGLMRDEEAGSVFLTGLDEQQPFYFAGPVQNPQAIGKVLLYDSYITYPFLIKSDGPQGEPSVAVRFLSKIDWDLLVNSGEDVVYFRKVPAFIDNVNMELYVDETSKGLKLRGIINQDTFKPDGELISTRGRLEYLDQVFRVDRFSVEFSRNNPLPFVAGRAWTTIRDSVGAVPKTIYIDLYAVDPETGLEKQEGSWEDFKFKLVSADPQIGETQEQVLAYMGYSVGNAKNKAVQVGGAVTERYLIRPLLRPVEKALERGLGMDVVRINSAIAQNLLYSTLGASIQPYGHSYLNPFQSHSSLLMLMQSSGVTVGKYLARNLFLSYTGQLVSIANQTDVEFGFNHSFGIEYRFLKNVLVEFKYDREFFGLYSGQPQQQYLQDFKIRLRHSFSF
ncbi:MAG TPA: hypothetical protein EYP36_05370 [Calditrichaeota bacterium]|nr:hypothetical protein [Calditrichota bacterium]